MLIFMRLGAVREDVDRVREKILSLGFRSHEIPGAQRIAIGFTGNKLVSREVKKLSHLPIAVDPSHGTGAWELVAPMAHSAVAAGADGLIIEVHRDPETAFPDGFQSLRPDTFRRLLNRLQELAPLMGRSVSVDTSVATT
jgi:hypothetical protein